MIQQWREYPTRISEKWVTFALHPWASHLSSPVSLIAGEEMRQMVQDCGN